MHYRLRYDRDNFMVADISSHEIRAKLGNPFILRHNPISPWAEMWQPLVMTFSDESDAKNVVALPDITVWFTDNLILSQKAYDIVFSTLEPYGEFLPVRCENIPYWVFHLTYITGIDAVDEERSERFID